MSTKEPKTQAEQTQDKELPSDVFLIGGKAMVARHRDGREEEVVIRLAKVRELPKLLTLLDDEPELLEHLCDKEEGWADSLTIDSHEELVEAALELNRPTLAGFIARRTDTANWGAQTVAPILRKLQELQSLGDAPKRPAS